MKKIISLILMVISVVTLTSCKKEEVKVLAPSGTPALSIMYIENNKDKLGYKIDVVNGADSLAAAFLSKSYDFILAPLNLGAKMYVNNKNYKLGAIVVNSNYYFVSQGEINKEAFLNKEIVIFGESQMSGILSRLILDKNYKLDLNQLNIRYVNSAQDSQSEFIKATNKENIICLIPEPALSVLRTKVKSLKAVSLKEEYSLLDSENPLPQAAVFVRSDLSNNTINKFLRELKNSINKINSNYESSSELGSTLFNNYTKEILLSALPNSEIKYTSAKDSKKSVEAFLSYLNNYNSNIIGGEVDENFYFE